MKNKSTENFMYFLKNSLLKKENSSVVSLRSDSDNGLYLKSVKRAVQDDSFFKKFKRDFNYSRILEHVSKEYGSECVEILSQRRDNYMIDALMDGNFDDSVGSPKKFYFQELSTHLSPTTLRYLKVCSDLKGLFGTSFGSVVEIGCGYGGQALVNDYFLKINRSYLVDLPLVNRLTEKYLNNYLLKGSFSTAHINNIDYFACDLVVSNYAFSELPRVLQETYITKIIKHARSGYLTMNSGLGGPHSSGKMSLEELLFVLPEAVVLREVPLSGEFNYILVWGHDAKFAEAQFDELVLSDL